MFCMLKMLTFICQSERAVVRSDMNMTEWNMERFAPDLSGACPWYVIIDQENMFGQQHYSQQVGFCHQDNRLGKIYIDIQLTVINRQSTLDQLVGLSLSKYSVSLQPASKLPELWVWEGRSEGKQFASTINIAWNKNPTSVIYWLQPHLAIWTAVHIFECQGLYTLLLWIKYK